jgi:hypothetical protein
MQTQYQHPKRSTPGSLVEGTRIEAQRTFINYNVTPTPIPFGVVVHQTPTGDPRIAHLPTQPHPTEIFLGISVACMHHASPQPIVNFPSFTNAGMHSGYQQHETMKVMEEGRIGVDLCPPAVSLSDIPCYSLNALNPGQVGAYPQGGVLPAGYTNFPCPARFITIDASCSTLHIDHGRMIAPHTL